MNLEELSKLIREQKEEMGMLNEVSIFKNKHPMKALYIFGPAGAGKSFLSKNIGVPSDFVNLNTDESVEEDFVKLVFIRCNRQKLNYELDRKNSPQSKVDAKAKYSRRSLE